MLLAAAALAAPPDWTGSVGVGLGGSVLVGGNAEAFGAGVAQRLAGDVAISRGSAFSVELAHTRHVVRDASAWFPGADVSADAMEGFRDYVSVDAGVRVGGVLPPDAPVGAVTAVPFARIGLAGVYTTTLLGVAGFDGRVALRSERLSPAASLGAGCEVRLLRRIAVVPHLVAQAVVEEDVGEVDGVGVWGVEWRLQPAVDASFHF
ncbi:MAG: hypothetical protein ACOZNI_26160 [Myxococcota bacterium]